MRGLDWINKLFVLLTVNNVRAFVAIEMGKAFAHAARLPRRRELRTRWALHVPDPRRIRCVMDNLHMALTFDLRGAERSEGTQCAALSVPLEGVVSRSERTDRANGCEPGTAARIDWLRHKKPLTRDRQKWILAHGRHTAPVPN